MTIRTIGSLAPARKIPPIFAGRDFSKMTLNAAALIWFIVMLLGQLLFLVYVIGFYGGAAIQGDFGRWTNNPRGEHITGDMAGNVAMGLHVLFSAVIILGGAIQLVPQVRNLAPAFHRWNGRVYVFLSVVSSVVGLGMVWLRLDVGDVTQRIGISTDAALIFFCSYKAVQYARAGNIRVHRQWALRLFMAVSAVWFYRVGLMLWLVCNRGVAGFDPFTLTGPFLSFLSFAQALLPIFLLEIYLRAQAGRSALGRFTTAAGLLVVTLAMAVGIATAAMLMWLPRL